MNGGDGISTVTIELDEDEWQLLRQHFQWGGPTRAFDSVAVIVGYRDASELYADMPRLLDLVDIRSPMAVADWRRLLISVELLFGSSEIGCALDWSAVTGFNDERTVTTLRRLQRKVLRATRPARP